MNKNIYDVVICGGGLAGLTLARQLRLTIPNISVALIDRYAYPLPEAAFKVGESTVYDGAHYFGKVLDLEDYFEKEHFPKLGLRYFYGDTTGEFHKRPEFGISEFPAAPKSYQLDRGKLENDLRLFSKDMGIELIENCLVQDIHLAENSEELHQVVYVRNDNKETVTISARWVVDAMSRRRFLQKKLGLDKPNDPRFNAVWFRVKGRFDLSEFVSTTEKEWHDRVPNNVRYFSTNHMCGEGYWVWLIPLSTGHTSVGIVANNEFQPFSEFHTYELACEWLEKNEPVVAYNLKRKEVIDFKKMPRYSYSTTQVFSLDRWGCVGEAAMFPDPLYSPGSDMIGYANSLQTNLIKLYFEGKLTQEIVDDANSFFISMGDGVSESIHNTYYYMSKGVLMGLKNMWDIASGSSFISPIMFNSLYLDTEKRDRIFSATADKVTELNNRVENLLLEWSPKSLGRVTFDFLDYWKLPFLKEIRSRNLKSGKTEQQLVEEHIINLEVCEEFAIAIFLLAVEDTMPELMDSFPDTAWINAWAISLDPNKWEDEGLFRPTTKPRDLSRVMEPLRKIYYVRQPMLALSR